MFGKVKFPCILHQEPAASGIMMIAVKSVTSYPSVVLLTQACLQIYHVCLPRRPSIWGHILPQWLLVIIAAVLMLNSIKEPRGMFTETFPLDFINLAFCCCTDSWSALSVPRLPLGCSLQHLGYARQMLSALLQSSGQ